MSKGLFGDILDQGLNEQISEWQKEGLNESEICSRLESINIENYISDSINLLSDSNKSYFKEKMYEIELEERAKTSAFLAHQEQIWGKCFAASQTMYTLTLEAAENYISYNEVNLSQEKKDSKQYSYTALQHIHGRACQVFLEILYLIRGGFADCAYARWRSIYELSCIAWFIKHQDEKIAKQYIIQSQTENSKYSWAEGSFDNNNKPYKVKGFNDIEKFCEMNKQWHKEYKTSCFVVHASPQGTFKRISVKEPTNIISVGQSDYGIAVPAMHSAISLNMINTIFLSVFTSVDSLVYLKTLKKWTEEICGLYSSTQKTAFNELE